MTPVLVPVVSLLRRWVARLDGVLPHPVWARADLWLEDTQIPALPDRVHLRETIIPLICRRSGRDVLSIGCGFYCTDIVTLLAAGHKRVWTIDNDPAVARWGSPGRHVVADAVEIDTVFAGHLFDVVICNGVLGWGLDSKVQVDRTLLGLARLMPPGALLVLGWNSDRTEDLAAYDLATHFRAAQGLAPVGFAGSTHVYACFERRSDA